MDTTAKVPRDTYKAMTNLIVSLEELRKHLRQEGRYVSSNGVDLARRALEHARGNHGIQTPGHD